MHSLVQWDDSNAQLHWNMIDSCLNNAIILTAAHNNQEFARIRLKCFVGKTKFAQPHPLSRLKFIAIKTSICSPTQRVVCLHMSLFSPWFCLKNCSLDILQQSINRTESMLMFLFYIMCCCLTPSCNISAILWCAI